MQVDRYELNDSDGQHYAVGRDLLGNIPGELKIRLTTAEERSIDRPKENKLKIEQQYSGASTSRDSIQDKAASKATVLAFDEVLATDDSGQNFRAHWPRTMSTVDKPATLLVSPVAYIELQQKTDTSRTKVFVEVIKSNVNLSSEKKTRRTIDKTFVSAFSPIGEDKNPQRPFAAMNLRYNGDPVFALLLHIYPNMTSKTVTDSDGKECKQSVPVSGEETMKAILSGERKGANAREVFALDVFRATYAALTNEKNVKIFSEGSNCEYVETVFKGIKSGMIEVNLASGASYNFGPASAQSYLADADKKYLFVFNLERSAGDLSEHVRTVNGYASVVLSMQQFDDGSHFVVQALSNEQYPKTSALNETDLVQANATQMLNKFSAPEVVDLSKGEQLQFLIRPIKGNAKKPSKSWK